MRYFLALFAFLPSVTNAAVDKWSLVDLGDLCVIEKTFTASEIPTTLTIYSKGDGQYLLTMANKGWSTEDGQKMVVGLRMDKQLSAYNAAGGKEGSVSLILSGDDFRRFQGAGLMVAILTEPARILEAFDLSGTRTASAKLIWCDIQHEDAKRESDAEAARLQKRSEIISPNPFKVIQP